MHLYVFQSSLYCIALYVSLHTYTQQKLQSFDHKTKH